MRKPLVLLVAGLLAFMRVLVVGFSAVYLGMTDMGGPASALLRILQLYGIAYAFFILMLYAKETLRKEALFFVTVVAAAAPIISSAAFVSLLRNEKSLPVDPFRAGALLLILVALDFVVLICLVIARSASRGASQSSEITKNEVGNGSND